MRVLGYKWRAVEALVAGAATGAAAVAGLYVCALVRGSPSPDTHVFAPFVGFVFMFAFAGWAVGLIALAAPLWWVLHKAGARSWQAAVIFGATAAFLGHAGLDAVGFRVITPAIDGLFSNDHSLATSGPWGTYRAHLAFAVIGAIVALVVWRIAYRPASRVSRAR